MSSGEKLTPFGNALSGAFGAVLALCITYPLDLSKTRLQVQTKDSAFSTHYNSLVDALQKIIHKEGVGGLYNGLMSALVGVFSTNFAYFYWYAFIRGSYLKYSKKNFKTDKIEVGMELLLGALSGAMAQLFTIPVSVITTRQQTEEKHHSMYETALLIIREEGWIGLWKGIKPSLVLTSNPAITYGLFESMKTSLLEKRIEKQLTSLETFFLGLCSKTIATIVTYPYIMAKVRLQWKPQDYEVNEKVRYKGAIDVLKKIYKAEGLKGWYKGLRVQILKAVLTQALLFVIKDKLTVYTLILLTSFKRLQNK